MAAWGITGCSRAAVHAKLLTPQVRRLLVPLVALRHPGEGTGGREGGHTSALRGSTRGTPSWVRGGHTTFGCFKAQAPESPGSLPAPAQELHKCSGFDVEHPESRESRAMPTGPTPCVPCNTPFCCTEEVGCIFTKSVVAGSTQLSYIHKVTTLTCIFHNTHASVSSPNALFSSMQVLNLETPILRQEAHNI